MQISHLFRSKIKDWYIIQIRSTYPSQIFTRCLISSKSTNWFKWRNIRGMKRMIRTRTASSRGNAVVNGSILRATTDRSSLNREKERVCNLHRKIERVRDASHKRWKKTTVCQCQSTDARYWPEEIDLSRSRRHSRHSSKTINNL